MCILKVVCKSGYSYNTVTKKCEKLRGKYVLINGIQIDQTSCDPNT